MTDKASTSGKELRRDPSQPVAFMFQPDRFEVVAG